ncbi:MAG: hypothetical protein WAK54_39085, partial [Bradyrhizobium sp.]
LGLIEAIKSGKKPTERVNVLTHCNAGWLATVDWGTATAPIYLAHDRGEKTGRGGQCTDPLQCRLARHRRLGHGDGADLSGA